MKKVIIILFTSIICLVWGIVTAYYNTASLGYDNANLISADKYELRIMDFVISKKAVRKNAEHFVKSVKPDFITI